jgi:hypothetical protein
MNKLLMGVAIAPLLLAVQAQAAGTAVTWTPSSIAFGNILVGQTSASKSITVSRGTITSGVTSASIAAATGVFKGNGALTASLLAGKTITSGYTFAPITKGAATKTIAVTGTNGSTTTSGTVALSGTGVAPVGAVTTTYAGPAYVLVGATNTFGITVTNSGNGNLSGTTAKNGLGQTLSNLNGSFGTLSNLTGGGGALSLADGAKTSASYSFAPTVKGATASGNIVTSLTNGKSDGSNAAFSVNTAVSLTAVAPVSAIATDAAAVARYNNYGPTGVNATTTGVTGITVHNTGNGDLASSSLGVQRNLNGSFGSPTDIFSGPVSGGGFSLTDGTSTDVTYNFDPTARGDVTNTVTGQFSNGSSDGKNTSFTTTATLAGTGVGPTYASAVGATSAQAQTNLATANTNTPTANTDGTSTIDFGTINSHVTGTLYLDIGNITTDANGGNALLTDLSLESAVITGSGAADFGIGTISTIVAKGGEYFVPVTFYTGGFSGVFSAVLTIQTDASTGFGLQGDTFSYNLFGNAVPEVSTWVMMMAGFVGLGFVGHARGAKRRSIEA